MFTISTDRTEPPENIAAAEVFEETGYRIGVDKLNLITRVVNGVGTSGERQHMFYTEVTDEQRETQGGLIDWNFKICDKFR